MNNKIKAILMACFGLMFVWILIPLDYIGWNFFIIPNTDMDVRTFTECCKDWYNEMCKCLKAIISGDKVD